MKKFCFSWFISSIIMFLLSYLWHGVFLNDFSNINYPIELFLGMTSVVYLVIGFVLTFLATYVSLEKRKTLSRLAMGGALGFFIYLIAFTLGVSFQGGSIVHVTVDFAWQMVEQGIGALVVSFIFVVFEHREKIRQLEEA